MDIPPYWTTNRDDAVYIEEMIIDGNRERTPYRVLDDTKEVKIHDHCNFQLDGKNKRRKENICDNGNRRVQEISRKRLKTKRLAK